MRLAEEEAREGECKRLATLDMPKTTDEPALRPHVDSLFVHISDISTALVVWFKDLAERAHLIPCRLKLTS